MEKANVVFAHQKGGKHILKNYASIPLLTIAEKKKIERILFINMFAFFT